MTEDPAPPIRLQIALPSYFCFSAFLLFAFSALCFVLSFPVLHHDAHLIVLDKPSGLLSVPGRGPDRADCLAARVAEAAPGALVVHRLDRDTSGVMVMALSRQVQAHLGRQFEQRRVSKLYCAVVHGRVEDDQGTIDLPMRLDVDNRPVQIVDHVHGRHAVTHYRVLERAGDRSRLELGSTDRLMLHSLSLELEHPGSGERVRFRAPCPF
jgi:tRNA pseudouridine32 synthase/23S rRNA pseudouridine746 synthase